MEKPPFPCRYRQTQDAYEGLSGLLSQLATGHYTDFSVYMNNLMHLQARQLEIMALFDIQEYRTWLKANDPDLWCDIIAAGNTFRMLHNLIVNLKLTLVCKK